MRPGTWIIPLEKKIKAMAQQPEVEAAIMLAYLC